ncbi:MULTISPECIES: heme oxygenase (biliverdin-producing) [unclassified Dietzia]|uniref:biliverdin-producing heme oxygenase n=1 Tax=unclassified Dietzia TaxID=2617939 RepID=UPI000D21A7B9|nr:MULTISPECIES: biliverdin-producing heme oxygenase [unclassified Dietzia]AVZ38747.1 biliverdin-producing heme oxygenase [Dietzia sp. JS16-p6b]
METIISAPLSRALHDSTMAAHEQAENALFITRLMNGEGTPAGLVALLRQSLPVYATLEDACRGVGADPRLSAILDPRLERTGALRADLESHRAQGRSFDTVVPATEAYVAELRACATDPAALIGHHYVRYLGDLSGGQIIRTMVRRHYGIETGLSFYDFDIAKPKVYKDDYRAALDALPLGETDRASALAAATRAFDLNHRIFLDLEALGVR